MARNLKLEVVLDAIDRASAPLKKIAAGSRGAGQAIRETRDHLRTLENAQKDLKGFANLKRSSEATAASLNDQQRKVRELTQQMNNAEGSTKSLNRQRTAAIKTAKKLKDRYGQEQRKLQDLRGSMRRFDGVTGSLSDQQRELARRVEATNKRLAAQQHALARIGKAKVGEKFRNMTSSVARFGRQAALVTTIAGGGLFALANSTAALGDDVAKTGDKIGIALGPFQEMRYAAELSGVSVQAFDSSLERFIKRTGEATMGTGAARKAFDELGLSAAEMAQLAPEDALGRVADRLSKVESHTKRVALAAQLFGREGVAMVNMLKDGSAGLEEMGRQGRITGYVLSDKAARDAEVFKDSLLSAQRGMAGLKNIIGAELMPVIADLMDKFSGWMIDNRDRVTEFAKTFAQRFREAIPTLISLGRGLASMAATIGTITSVLAGMVGGFDNLGVVLAALWAMKPIITIIAFGKALWGLSAGMVGLAATLPGVSAGFAAAGTAIAATPIGWIIAGIAAVVAAGVLLYKYWDYIAAFFVGFWRGLKTGFAPAVEALTAAWKLFGVVLSPLKPLWQFLATGARILFGWMRKLIAPVDATTEGLGKAAMAGELLARALTFFPRLIAESVSFGADIAGGILKGIFSGLSALKNGIRKVGRAIGDGFKNVLGINSPSKVFAGFGANTMQGYQQGIKAAEKGPLRQVGDVAKRIGRAGAGIALGGALATGAAALPGSIGVGTSGIGSIPIDSRGSLSGGGGNGGVVIQGGINISVTAGVGMDEQALASYVAREVQRALEEANQRASARKRSALHDLD